MKYFYLTLLAFTILISCSAPNKKAKEKNTPEKNVTNAYYEKALKFRDTIPNTDSAFYYFNEAKDLFLKQNENQAAGKCLINMAMISIDRGDYFGTQEISLEALKYLDRKNKEDSSLFQRVYHELGFASANLNNHKQAISFYNQSIPFAKDSTEIQVTKNNIANAYAKIGDYANSFIVFKSLINKKMSSKTYSKILSNYAFNKWKQNPQYNAKPELLKALQIRKKENDMWGLNASYSHLADYYTPVQPDTALAYAHKMYTVANEIESPDDQLESLLKIIKLSPAKETKKYFGIYQKINDSLQNARSMARNQFALVRYDSEKNRANFLKAQAENIKKNIGIGILAIILIGGYFWYRRRQKSLRQEKEIEVKKTELKYVKKIHDHVANKVYQVINEIDNSNSIDKDVIADKLDVIYKISRDLSYEKEIRYEKNFALEVSKMIYSYSSANVDIQINGNDEKIWEGVNDTVKSEIMPILQELMTNMTRHSGADTVTLKFNRKNQLISILYTDNGKGIEKIVQGNGLKNTETRMESISGLITFDSEPNKGLLVEISFPVL